MTERPVYLDCQSTTPLDPRVVEVMVESFGVFGNPHGRQHAYGRRAADAVAKARHQVASLISTYPRRIVFTSGATESCNLALRGVAAKASPRRRKVVTFASEHAAVLETVSDLGRSGFDAIVLPVASDGLVDLDRLEDTVDDSTLLVSAMAVNNEIGVLQPLKEIASICQQHGTLFHTDATQAPARIPVDVEEWGVDLLSMSSHKLYGPKGVGALYVADDSMLEPMWTGGGQERGIRSGTLPTPLVCGFAEAADIAMEEQEIDAARMGTLAARLRSEVEAMSDDVLFFGSDDKRAPGTLSFGFRGVSGDHLVTMVESDVAISTGAACSSSGAAVSHVIAALGCPYEDASTAVRVGLGRFTSDEDIGIAVASLQRAINGAGRG